MTQHELTLTFLLDEEVTPDLFAEKVARSCPALREGEAIRLPSSPDHLLVVGPKHTARELGLFADRQKED